MIQTHQKPTMRAILEEVIQEMVTKGILWSEAQQEFEKIFITTALQRCGGNMSRTAKQIGIHRNTLSKKLKEYKIVRGRHKRT